MGLRDLDIKKEYRTGFINIAKGFLVPILSESISYKRAVGFFSSSSLVVIAQGLGRIASNGGKIQLIASPRLSEEDVSAISSGYKLREEFLKDRLLAELPRIEEMNLLNRNRFNLLANLIAENFLDIRIAFAEGDNCYGIYHEKVAIVEDKTGDKIAFSGSMNESANAMCENYEAIDVFRSWDDPDGRVLIKEHAFDNIWNGNEKGLKTFEFPEIKDEIVKKYLFKSPDYNDDLLGLQEEQFDYKFISFNTQEEAKYPRIPESYTLRNYQDEAIESWENEGYRGIYDMATGTGKTVTALASVVKLSDKLKYRLAVIIVCPFQHLVDQWVEDIELFNIAPIIGYSTSPQKDWFKKLTQAIRDQNHYVQDAEFFCFVCTNGTFATEKVQNQIAKIKTKKLLIIDEAHNFGASYLRSLLDDSYEYRLALSATFERFGDSEGTQILYDFFGNCCIKYTLDEAILGRDDEPPCLTPYRYYPKIVFLEDDELAEYSKLSKEIAKSIISDGYGGKKLSEVGKRLALKRARIVAGARQKISELEKVVSDYQNDNFMLVYCGATKVEIDSSIEFDAESDIDEFEMRQIDIVTRLLGNKLNMRVRQFTSRESNKEREEIKEMFSDGERLQALIAIKCLDEGVNIPMIKTAFILASTTNPREYIQRRGRLLRKDKDGKKERAEIYDFITLPRNPQEVSSLTDEETKGERSMVYNELIRAKEFARLAENKSQVLNLIDELEEDFFGLGGLDSYHEREPE